MRSAMRMLVRGVCRNIAAGARLALFRRVGPLDFRISPIDFTALVAVCTLASFGGSFVRGWLPGYFNLAAVPIVLAEVSVVLFFALLAAAIAGRRDAVVGLATALFAADPFFELVAIVVDFASGAATAEWAAALGYGFLLWAFATTLRALWVLVPRRGLKTALAGATLTAMFLGFLFLAPRAELWVHVEPPTEAAAIPSIADEELFHRQQRLLDEALAALAPQRPGVEDLYFLGVAPYSSEDVFVRETASVRKLFDERFGTAGRSIVLANSPDTLGHTPIATATNLRAVLERLGKVLDADEDMLFLFITTHGDARHELAFELPPLALHQLTPTALGRMLHASGIKWKVLVVSACFSGGYVEPLKDANTVVITAADARSTSFGCANGRDFTYFGHAYFNDALARTFSFVEAFEAAKRAVTEQERVEGLAPSSPQIWIGSAIRDKLGALERRLRALR